LIAVGLACGAGGVRPRFAPFPDAIADTITAAPDSAILVAGTLLVTAGLEVRHMRPIEGYVETHWFNVESGERSSGESTDTDSTIRIRLWADPVTEHQTVMIGEAVRPRIVDPSMPMREREVSVSEEHVGHEILHRVLEGIREHFTTGAAQ
jgi:hypothetical protein